MVMAGAIAVKAPLSVPKARPAATEGAWGRRILIGITVAFLTLFVLVPLINVFEQAFAKGLDGYLAVFFPPEPDPYAVLNYSQKRRLAEAATQAARTWHSIGLTVAVASIVIPMNVIFGLAAAWATTKFNFKGRTLIASLIDLPFSVSPVVAGLVFVLLLGRNGILGGWATQLVWPDIFSLRWVGFSEGLWPFGFEHFYTGVIFTPLAIVIATIFVTFPFVARSLAPLMANQGPDEETAALSLGASGWRTFFKITVPNVKWALLYGVILTMTRAFGEFGAVSVVSGHIDVNDTMPLRIEKLWNEYNNQAAFSVASVLTFLALVSLVAKIAIEWKTANEAKR
jgi:sulfate/thiosulfate transport system permease protein